MAANCSMDVENVFGPVVAPSCLKGIDFTLRFEESILTILPLSLAMAWAIARVARLWKRKPSVRRSWLFGTKMTAYSVYLILNVALLALWADDSTPTTSATLAAAAVTVSGYVLLPCLSFFEHTRALQPSTPLTLYLGLSSLLDLPRLRTLFHVSGQYTVARVNLASFIVKLILLSLELVEKRRLLLPAFRRASPEMLSGIYNRALYIWLNSLFLKGFRSTLTVSSLTPLAADVLAASRPTSLNAKWEKAAKSSKNALLWTFMWHYKWGMLGSVLPRLAHSAFLFTEPFLLQRVLEYMAEPSESLSNGISYGLIGAYAIVHIGKAVTLAFAWNVSNRVAAMFRGSLVTFIFSKTLRLHSAADHEADAITLMSADIDRIDMSMHVVHDVYTSLIELPVSLWLLYRLLGVSVSAPAAYSIACVFIGIPIAAAAGNAQGPWLEAIESRLAATSKVLGAMKAMKMTGLANRVYSLLSHLRLSEIHASRRYRIMTIADLAVYYASSFLIPVFGFGMYALLARANSTHSLTGEIAFAALGLFSLQQAPLVNLVTCFEDIQTLVTSFRRTQEYIMSEERFDARSIQESRVTLADGDSAPQRGQSEDIVETQLHEQNLVALLKNASGGYSSDRPFLNGLDLKISDDKITMVTGPVGCGKSTLLKLLLGELPEISGSIITSFAKAAYCSQAPWITWGTIKDNIVGMSKWDKPWYNTVVRACALVADLESLPDGDQTKTGTRGSRLSGGQKIRVGLARALYCRYPVVILDGIMDGLDRATEKHILDHILGRDGLLKTTKRSVILATHSVHHLHYADHIIVLNKDGAVAEQGTMEELTSSGGYVQRLATQPPSTTLLPEADSTHDALQEFGILDEDMEPDNARRTGDVTVYGFYIRTAGKWVFLLYLLACATCVFGFMFPSIWLQRWTNFNANNAHERVGYWLGVYGAISVLAIVGCSMSDWILRMILVPKTSRKFHEMLLTTTMRATTSALTSTAAGHTTNRFSQDLEQVDNDLPGALEPVLIQLFSVIVSAVLVCIGSGYVAATIPVFIVLLYLVQNYYLRTSRQLRFLDIEAKAPLFSQFLEASGGVSSIRAYGWTAEYMERSYDVLDASQKPFYLLKSTQRWLNLVLDLLVAGIAILLVAFATNLPGGSTNFLGVALFSVIDFSSTLQSLVTQWTRLETAIGAIARILSYIQKTECENFSDETQKAPQDWPDSGSIVFDNTSATYQALLDPVLRQISFTVQPGEKVAICGRTGSGKSSLVASMLRMLEVTEGTISVDGIDLGTVARDEVRQRFNTLPQEPFFLHGNVRENIDPLGISSDEAINASLDAVQLRELVESRGGLDWQVDPDELSHGERQLMCLARAIIKPSKVVIMDEATSSIDSETEEVIQRAIRKEFRGRTIIAVVHKLDTVLDFDQVILMEQGRIIERGNPLELLAAPDSSFRDLYGKLE